MNHKLQKYIIFSDRKRLHLDKLPRNSAAIIREYDLQTKEREKIARSYDLKKVIIGKNLSLANKLRCAGVHFSDHDCLKKSEFLKLCRKKNLRKDFIFSMSFHSIEFAKKALLASRATPDIIFISPIFKTKSHPDAKPLGLLGASRFVREVKKLDASASIYALGGINYKNIHTLKKIGFDGFGGIDMFSKYL